MEKIRLNIFQKNSKTYNLILIIVNFLNLSVKVVDDYLNISYHEEINFYMNLFNLKII